MTYCNSLVSRNPESYDKKDMDSHWSLPSRKWGWEWHKKEDIKFSLFRPILRMRKTKNICSTLERERGGALINLNNRLGRHHY